MSSKYAPKLPPPKFTSAPKKEEPSSSKGRQDGESSQRSSKRDRSDRGDRGDREDRDSSDRRHHRRHIRADLEHRERHRSRTLSPAREPEASVERSASAILDKVDDKQVYFFDKRGDPLITRYGTNDRRRVPTYRRRFRRTVLGSSGILSIERDGEREFFVIRGVDAGGDSSFRAGRDVLAKVGRLHAKPVRLRRQDEEIPDVGRVGAAVDGDFIPLRSKHKDHGKGVVDKDAAEGGVDDDQPVYRSIEGMAKAHEFSDSELDFGSDSSSADDEAEDGVVQDSTKSRAIELNRRVRDHPRDVDAWLELIDLQDAHLRERRALGKSVSSEEAKSIADIKVSMYEKALAALGPTPSRDRERLLVGLMTEAMKIWSAKKLADRWAAIDKDDISSLALWKLRTDAAMTDLSAFGYDSMRRFHVQRLKHLNERMNAASDAAVRLELAEQAVYVFLRLTCLLRSTGYTELATAAWQAFLELTCARVGKGKSSRPPYQLRELFDRFWERELPRIGEDASRGFRHFLEWGGGDGDPEPRGLLSLATEPLRTGDVYKAWADNERRRAAVSRMPARTLDDGADDDPFRVVIFEDLEDLLLILPEGVIDDVMVPVINAFLMFCRLPPAFPLSETMSTAVVDSFVSGGSKSFEKSLGQAPEGNLQRDYLFTQDGMLAAPFPEVLFAGPKWFKYLHAWDSLYTELDLPVDPSWARNTIAQLVNTYGVAALAEYHLALEWTQDPSRGKKVARSLLKDNPTSASLYNAYALAEWASGNQAVAEKAVASAIGLQQSDPSSAADTEQLYLTWAWFALDAGDKNRTLVRLCALANPDLHASAAAAEASSNVSVSPTDILQARNTLSNRRDYLRSANDVPRAVLAGTALALLLYVAPVAAAAASASSEPQSAAQGDIAAALAAFEALSTELVGVASATLRAHHERLLQQAARLVHLHCTRGPYRSAFITAHLRRSLGLFPRNTIFLSLLSWAAPPSLFMSSASPLDDPVRDALRTVVLGTPGSDGLPARVFAIAHELHHGTVFSVRAAFEDALADGVPTRASEWLWRCYVRFCAVRGAELLPAKERRRLTRLKSDTKTGDGGNGSIDAVRSDQDSRRRQQEMALAAAAARIARDVFFRAVAACPGSRDLCLEAFAYGSVAGRGGLLEADELRAVFETMLRKGFRVAAYLDDFRRRWQDGLDTERDADESVTT